METATGNNCIKCGKVVRARQHGILCEDCSRWQHRTCQTGISISDYRKAVSGKLEINWKCQDCSVQSINQSRVSISHLIPDAESTRLSVPAESILRDAFSDDHQLSFPVDDDEVEAVDAEMDVNDDSATSDTSDSDDDSDTSDTSDSDDDSDTSDTSDSDDSGTSESDDSDTSESDDSDTPDSDDDSDTPESDDTSDTSDSDNEELLNSIHPAHVSFSVPQPVEESSVIDEEPDVSIHHDSQVTYELVEKSSQRMKDKLIDSLGYTYNVKRRRGTCVYWQCTVRNRVTNCKATVIEKNGSFRAGMHPHIHSSQPGSAAVHKVRADIKKMAAADHFRSAAVIAEEVLASQMTEEPLPTLPSVENLALCANRYRKKMRPPEPKDLEFVVDESYIPEEFYRGDVKVGNRRHLIFATNYQLDLLSLSKAWYVDATFNVVKAPFTQLFTVHSFIRKDGEAKQVPLIFVLMSGKSKHDYKKVMRKIKSLLPRHASVQKIVTDFEAAIWRGCLAIFSTVTMQGCLFHWCQALKRKLAELGLLRDYNKKGSVYRYCKKILSLPFLPHEQIPGAFYELKSLCSKDGLKEFLMYVEKQWIRNSFFDPSRWSIYMEKIRTNNDLEGWHHRLNYKAKRGQLQFYLLIELLHREGSLVTVQTKLVSTGKLKAVQEV